MVGGAIGYPDVTMAGAEAPACNGPDVDAVPPLTGWVKR